MALFKNYSGFTENTSKNLLLDAGAFFKNFDVKNDTFATAVTAKKLLGATKGGGEFNAKPTVRAIEVDGVKGEAKGLKVVDDWAVSIKASVIEVTSDVIVAALGMATSATASEKTGYNKITGNSSIADTDYIDNITWVGTLTGSEDPVIIQVYNALSTEGLSLKVEQKNNATVELSFVGHYDPAALDTPPFAIFTPVVA